MAVKPLCANADSSIRCNFEFISNVSDVSDSHLEKHSLQRTSTEEGIIIAVKPLHANADASIRCNFEFISNVTDVSE
jgi:hypothetical protein